MRQPPEQRFVPALRFPALTRFYDIVLGTTPKETKLKGLLVRQAGLRPAHRVLDLGCGTATLTIMLKRACPEAEVVASIPTRPPCESRGRRPRPQGS